MMAASISKQCQACATTLETIISTLSNPVRQKDRKQVNNELERFNRWMRDTGANLIVFPQADYVLTHTLEVLDSLNEAARDRGSAT